MVRLDGDTHRPHQRATDPDLKRKGRKHRAPSDPPAALKKNTIVEKILKQAQSSTAEVERVRFSGSDALTAQAQAETVSVADRELFVGGQRHVLSAEARSELTLLGPNVQVISAIQSALRSGRSLLLSAAPGSGTAFTARWALAAMGKNFEFVRLSRATSLETLSGALRPAAEGQLRVEKGPLTKCLDLNGVLLVDGIHRADPQVSAALRALASGIEVFYHPVTGDPISIGPGVVLVLIGDRRTASLAQRFGTRNVREIRAYDELEHCRLLIEQLRLPAELAGRLARFHQLLLDRIADSDLDFGHQFPLAFGLLWRAGRRIARLGRDVEEGDVARVLLGVYGARLFQASHRQTFEAILQELGLWPPKEHRPAPSEDPSFVHTPRVDRVLSLAADALEAGEMVHLRGPGQCGITRIVDELGRRRRQEIVTVGGHSGVDAQVLLEKPTFDERGRLILTPGRLSRALLDGHILHVSHLDHLPKEQQSAIFELEHIETVRVREGEPGHERLVDRPVHPDARIIVSSTTGSARGRITPEIADRAATTEIAVDAPDIDELTGPILDRLIQDGPGGSDKAEVRAEIVRVAQELASDGTVGRIGRMQKFEDFARTAMLLRAQGVAVSEAVARAADFVYVPKSTATRSRTRLPPLDPPMWRRILKLDDRAVEAALEGTGYRITKSMYEALDCAAIALALGRRSVRVIGPAGAGKTVLGQVLGALLDKSVVRVNLSRSTEGQCLLSSMGPKNEDGKTVFREVLGPARRAAELKAILLADEFNVSREAQMAIKSAMERRARLVDLEGDHEESFQESFLLTAENPSGSTRGRFEPQPEVADVMFTVFLDARPIEQKIEAVIAQCPLRPELIRPIAEAFADLEVANDKGLLRSNLAPITTTERDMLKAARTALYLIGRDGVDDREEQRRIVGRETYRVIRDHLEDRDERALVLDLVRRAFGDDVEPPPRPQGAERVGNELRIGVARHPIQSPDPELKSLVPPPERLKAPVGVQFEFVESMLLGAEVYRRTRNPVTALGITGAGKTMLLNWLARELNQPVVEQPYNEEMLEEHIFGAPVVDKDEGVRFKYGDLPWCIKKGVWYVGDEPTTLQNSVRETLNAVTEGSEIQILQARPPERIPAPLWHPDFCYFETTNGDDTRTDGFSEPEASRRRIVVLPELDTLEDHVTIALRDHLAPSTPDRERLSNELEHASKLFWELRQLQRRSTEPSPTPLTLRIFDTFIEAFVDLRARREFPDALMRSAELFLRPALPQGLWPEMMNRVVELVGSVSKSPPTVPELGEGWVRYGDITVTVGSEPPWRPSNERFPLTESRCANLQALAEAMELGRGRPIGVVDDENGEAMETLREYGRQTGHRLVEINLPHNVELELYLERLVRRPVAPSSKTALPPVGVGFEPELQEIGQAIRDGSILVLRNCGQVSTNRLERLNSLGDGRRKIRLPISGEDLHSPSDFRLVLMRTPDSVHRYSVALQGRLVTPALTTQESPNTDEAREARAAELAAVLRARCGISREACERLSVFHVFTNHMLREGRFASGKAVGTFLNHDAETVGRRLAWLLERRELDDENEALVMLVDDVYGSRFVTPTDRERLLKFAQDAFETESTGARLSADITPAPNLTRVGPWAVTRDPRGRREDLPRAESVLPRGPVFDRVLLQVAAAAQEDPVIHFTGNEFIADAAVASLAQMTTSPIFHLEGNSELPETQLFGGTAQDQTTGEFEVIEGLIFELQRKGGILVINDASRLPPEIQTRLVQIAATGRLQRVKDGVIEEPVRAFRLVLKSTEPLPSALSSVVRTIRCPEIVEADDLNKAALQRLRRVPGGRALAEALVGFHLFVAASLEGESLHSRQELSVDAGRLIEAADDIARLVGKEEVPFERAVAEVLARLYLRPLEGLAPESAVLSRFEELVQSLDGWLELEPETDIGPTDAPEIEALRGDYAGVSSGLESALLRAVGDALQVALDKGDPRKAQRALGVLLGSHVRPRGLSEKLANLQEKLSESKGSIDTGLARDLQAFAARVAAAHGAQEGSDLSDALLPFVRAARVWDLDHRLEILARYEDHFGELSKLGSGLAKESLRKLDSVRERFDAAEARERLDEASRQVAEATIAYRQHHGADDPQLSSIFKKLLSTWDLVSTSPIFRSRALPELHELEKHILALESAYEARGEPLTDVRPLSEAIRKASRTLEGIRIAEQSAELRRGLHLSSSSTRETVGSLRREIDAIKSLRAAEHRLGVLARAENTLLELLRSSFFAMEPGLDEVDRPQGKSEAELTREAHIEAEREAEKLFARGVDALMVDVHTACETARKPPVARFFEGYNLDLWPPPESTRRSSAEKVYDAGLVRLEDQRRIDIERLTEEITQRLRNEDARKTERELLDRVRRRVQDVGARMQGSATSLSRGIRDVSKELGVVGPLAEAAANALGLLKEADAATGTWTNQCIAVAKAAQRVAHEALRTTLKWASFGFVDLPTAEVPKMPDLGEAKRAAKEVLTSLLSSVREERETLPNPSEAETHEKKADRLVDNLLSAAQLGELATKYSELERLRKEETDGAVKTRLSAVLRSIASERGMHETLAQVAAFCSGADALSGEAARGGVSIDLAGAVDAVMSAAEAVRTQSLSPGAYKHTIKALDRSLAAIDALKSEVELPRALLDVRREIEALKRRIEEMFVGRRDLLRIDKEGYRSKLRSLSAMNAEGSRAGRIDAAYEATSAPAPLANASAHSSVEPLAHCIDLLSTRRSEDELSGRPQRAVRLTVIDLSFETSPRPQRADGLSEALREPEDAQDSPSLPMAQASTRRLREAIEADARDRTASLGRERARVVEIFEALEAEHLHSALARAEEDLDEVSACLRALTSGEQGVRLVARELRKALGLLRSLRSRLMGLESAPERAISKLGAAIESARTLESAFETQRFLDVAREWAVSALLTATEVSALVDGVVCRSVLEGSSWLADLNRLVDEMAGPIGLVGAWSRLSMLIHARQRIESLSVDEHDRSQFAEIVRVLDSAIEKLREVAESAEEERAAAEILELTIELGTSMEKDRNLGQVDANDYEELTALVGRILAPRQGAPSEEDRSALTSAIGVTEKITGRWSMSSSTIKENVRHIGLALGHLRFSGNTRVIDATSRELRGNAEQHLSEVRDACLLLGESANDFLSYDPLKSKKRLSEVAQDLRMAIGEAALALKGPGSSVLGEALIDLGAKLAATSAGAHATEAKMLLDELEPLLRQAESLRDAHAAERFTRMVAAFQARTAPGRTRSDELVKWAEWAEIALTRLTVADVEEVARLLDNAENRYFPELAERTSSESRGNRRPEASDPEDGHDGHETSQIDMLRGPAGTAERSASGLSAILTSELSGIRRGLHQLGLNDVAPDPPAEDPAIATAGAVRGGEDIAPAPGQSLGEIRRAPLSAGDVTSRSDAIRVIELEPERLREIRDRLQKAAEERAVDAHDSIEEPPPTEFEAFAISNARLVEKMAGVLRQFPGLETVIVIDQSGSTDHPGLSRIILQERAAMALVMAAHQRAERSCAVVGFGDLETGRSVRSYVHKPMAVPLDREACQATYQATSRGNGGTDLIGPMNVALGQFTSKANNKLILVLTDAQLNRAADVRRYVDMLRAQGVGVAMLGFGDAVHVQLVAGEFGQHVSSYEEAIDKTPDLFSRTVVHNAGRFRGVVEGAAEGIGVPVGQAPMEAAPSNGPVEAALLLSNAIDIPGSPAEVFAAQGAARPLANLVERSIYDRALKAIEHRHKAVANSPTYRAALQTVKSMRARHARQGTIEALTGAIVPVLPRTQGLEWQRKQLSGSSFDEQQLLMYVAGLAQGVPVQRIFKRRRGSEQTKATVVLSIDESSSMGNGKKLAANLEALFACADALKASDPEVKIAVVGYGDRVRLHAGFEQEWDDELKAHILHQVRGEYDATDDERAAAEAIGLLRMVDAELGVVLNFSDGQGMPGMQAVMESAKEYGYAFLTCGVGPDCIGVSRFGPCGLYARDLAHLVQVLSPALFKSWELAGRLS